VNTSDPGPGELQKAAKAVSKSVQKLERDLRRLEQALAKNAKF
jgi:hypothetical protein